MNKKYLILFAVIILVATLIFFIISSKNQNKNCGSITDQKARDDCYHSLAHSTNNRTLCNYILDDGEKGHCLGHILDSNQNKSQEQKIKLSETRYWDYAYLISGDNLDEKAKAALSGFDLKKETLPDGSVKITLKALSQGYNDQMYFLKEGEKLYFIETSWGDDPQFKEYNLGDDVAVKVDSEGDITK